jgi:lipopolysaccharide/colanic/teichoic acid biosynthesis glycosyltransferase
VLGVLLESGPAQMLDKNVDDLPVLGQLDDWETVVDQLSVRCLILGFSTDDFHQYARAYQVAKRCQEKGIAVQVYSDLLGSCEFHYERDEFSGCFRFSSPPSWSRPVQMAAKAVMDRLVGIIGSIVALALTPVVALMIRMEDPGPVFYRREFVDQDEVVRYYLKFRTMVTNADDELRTNHALKQQFNHKYKLEQDPRVLKVGRFLRKYSIDEFPQFFSLLSGRLSFVGPRVISDEERSRYGGRISKLLSVKPGLTGYWQVTGRQTTSYEERVDMDMFYIDHWSIWLDLVIAAKTLWKVLRADGAY